MPATYPTGTRRARLSAFAVTQLCWALLLIPCAGQALECPAIPAQARKDWAVEVSAAVGKLGAAKGAELATLTRSTTRDLLGKLPQADKVYLEQMMYATYCSALRDDRTLTEAQKSERIRAYNLELRKALHGTQGKAAGSRKLSAKDTARQNLERLPLPYTPDAFVESAGKGDLAAVKLFLAAGMEPNATNRDGGTALMHAAGNGHAKIVETLLKAKAKANVSNDRNAPALAWAASGGHAQTLRLLLDQGPDAAAIEKAFGSAAKSGNADILPLLAKHGIDRKVLNSALRDVAGSRISDDADDARTDGVVRYLLAQGAEVDARDEDGWTALLQAAAADGDRERVAIGQTLLEAGADVNARCTCTGYLGGGWTALMIAAREARNPLLKLLLARGADPNIANNEGQAALAIALDHGGDPETVRALLERGAEVNARDKEGATPLMEAVNRMGSRMGSAESMRTLLARQADVHARALNGWTVLMLAAAYGNVEAIELLLDAGADLHARTPKGRTALMLAVSEGRSEAVLGLLRRGAKADDADADGKTVLNYAEEDLEGKERTEMLRILTKAGAK